MISISEPPTIAMLGSWDARPRCRSEPASENTQTPAAATMARFVE
jgi:hypothetical protein